MSDTLTAPQEADESALYAAMEKELGPTQSVEPSPEPAKQDAQLDPKVEQPKKDEPAKPERSVEELERNYRNLQGALNEERTTRRELNARLEEQSRTLQNMQALMARLRQGEEPEQQNPLEPIVHQIRRLHDGLESVQRETAEQREQRELYDYAVRAEREFSSSTPDYLQAAQHLAQARMAELQVLLPDGHPQIEDAATKAGHRSVADYRMALINEEQKSLARAAKANGLNPAELVYRISVSRGWKAPAPQQQQAKPTAQAQVETIRRGQQAAASLSGGGVAADAGDSMSLNDLADLYMKNPEAADRMFNRMKSAGMLG